MPTHLKDSSILDPRYYTYADHQCSHAHAYLIPEVQRILNKVDVLPRRLFDLGCGNGSVANHLSKTGWQVSGVDPSAEGIAQARAAFPGLRLEQGSAYDEALISRFGRFPVVISLEVIEHVYAPRSYVRTLFDLLEPGGMAIISTPYHGYWKNVALAITGRLDKHFTALWDHGHIKFWSMRTLSALLWEAGFIDIRFSRVGRISSLAKSMIAIAYRPDR